MFLCQQAHSTDTIDSTCITVQGHNKEDLDRVQYLSPGIQLNKYKRDKLSQIHILQVRFKYLKGRCHLNIDRNVTEKFCVRKLVYLIDQSTEKVKKKNAF